MRGRRAWALSLLLVCGYANAQPAPDGSAAPIEPAGSGAAPTQPAPSQPPAQATPAEPSAQATPAEPSAPATPAEPAPPPGPPPAVVVRPPPPPRDKFPLAWPDRPIVLPAGTTELDVSQEFRTYVQTMTDMMGNVSRERIGFADDRTTVISAAHAFGRVEVSASIGLRARLGVAIDTGSIPTRVSLNAAFGVPQRDGRYSHIQYANATHRFRLLPGRLAIAVGATLTMTELLAIIDSMKVEGAVISADVGASVYVQIAWRFAMSAGTGFGAPLWQSEAFGAEPRLGVHAYLYLALRKWDFYVGGNLFDVTRPEPGTFFTFGFQKRWGL